MAVIGNPTKYQDFPLYESISNGVATSVTLPWTPGSQNAIDVFVGGALQTTGAYSVNGNIISFTSTPTLGDKIIVKSKGIRSSWQPRTKVTEHKITATAGQTVFTTIYPYVVGTSSIAVYVNGVRKYHQQDYNETSNVSITLISPAALNDKVLLVSGLEINGNAVDSDQIGFIPTGTISSSNVSAALAELDSEKAPVSTTATTASSQTLSNKTMTSITNVIEATSGPSASSFMFRNKLINGNMTVNQRGSGTGVSQLSYMMDRWLVIAAASTYNWSLATGPNEDLPGALLFGKASGAVPYWVAQRIENVRTLQNRQVTVQFWIKATSPVSLTAAVNLQQNFGVGGSASVNVPVLSNLSVTTAWQKITATATIASVAGKTFGTGHYLELSFGIPDTTTGIYLAGVQLEEGSVATPFENRPYGLELSLCQRYYETGAAALMAYQTAGNNFYQTIPYKVQKRSVPTLTITSPTYFNSSAAFGTGLGDVTNQFTFGALTTSLGTAQVAANWQSSAEL